MTESQSLGVRRCTCSECDPMGMDSSATRDDAFAETRDLTLTEDEVRSWVSAERVADRMPLRSRIWRTER